MRLRSLQLTDYRCYDDTEKVDFKSLNLFIGANNAGKTSFLSAIELLIRGLRFGGREGPLAFSTMPNFASFESLLRRHWNRKQPRAQSFRIKAEWQTDDQEEMPIIQVTFDCKGNSETGAPYVDRALYRGGDDVVKFSRIDDSAIDKKRPNVRYLTSVGEDAPKAIEYFFEGLFPIIFADENRARRFWNSTGRSFQGLEVIRPFRPVPRSYYVLDDPGLDKDDRGILTFLLDVWHSDDSQTKAIRTRIEESLKTLGLATKFEVVRVTSRIGPKVVELRVSPTISRQRVTIADAGFGVSQALPLVAYDARLANGFYLAYQPEVHLHPYAQSRLADIFVSSVKRKNQIFVETHSVDLILRLQLLIASGEIDPGEVKVFCFENKNGRSTITPIDFKKGGIPEVPWPSGFLDNSVKLARDLVVERNK